MDKNKPKTKKDEAPKIQATTVEIIDPTDKEKPKKKF